MKGYNTSLGYPETYGASAWLQSAFPPGATSSTIRYDGASWVSNSFLFNTGSAVSIGSTTIDVDASNGRLYVQNTGGLARQYIIGSSSSRLAVWGKSTGATFSLNTGGTTTPGVSYYIGNQTISTTDLMTFGRRAGNFGDPIDGDVMRLDGVNKRVLFGFLSNSALPLANMHVGSNSSDNNTLYLDNILVGAPGIGSAPGITFRGRPQSGDDPRPYARILGAVENTGNASTYDGQIQLQTALNGTLGTNVTILSSGNVGIGTTAPARTLHVTGTERVTGSLDTATIIALIGTSALGDRRWLTLGAGLSFSGGTLTTSASGTVSGTTGKIAKFTGSTAVGNSLLTESGSVVSIDDADTFAGKILKLDAMTSATRPTVENGAMLYNATTHQGEMGTVSGYRQTTLPENGAGRRIYSDGTIWTHYTPAYGEMSIFGSSTITFLSESTTFDTLSGFTLGEAQDFVMQGSALQYTGTRTIKVQVTASLTCTFDEDTFMEAGLRQNSTSLTKSRSRGHVYVPAEPENIVVTGILTLAPNDLIRIEMAPGSHTGDSVITVTRANFNITEI
jgi:hypothetical protein